MKDQRFSNEALTVRFRSLLEQPKRLSEPVDFVADVFACGVQQLFPV